jgi:hypothetical protein
MRRVSRNAYLRAADLQQSQQHFCRNIGVWRFWSNSSRGLFVAVGQSGMTLQAQGPVAYIMASAVCV